MLHSRDLVSVFHVNSANIKHSVISGSAAVTITTFKRLGVVVTTPVLCPFPQAILITVAQRG